MNRQPLFSIVLLWCLAFAQIGTISADTDRASRFGNVDLQLDGIERAAEDALADRTSGATKFRELLQQVNELKDEIMKQEQLEKELVRRTLAVDVLVRKANAVQLKYLARQLNLTIDKELQERMAAATSAEEESHVEEVDGSNAVTLEEMEQQTQTTQLLEDSEAQVEEWIRQQIVNEIAKYHAQAAESCSPDKCVTPVEAAQLVQESLTTYAQGDGVNMVDHALGGTIVYELTSQTYDPPADDPTKKLGNVWWRKYIPQDWERLLPSQWEEWKADMPSFMKHSFGFSSDTVPPEAILTTGTLPGSCWPLAGRRGQVTIRLPYPVKVKAVTIDHTSPLLVGDDVNSAPRFVRVIAYPSCSDCDGMGFDVDKAWELTAAEFDIDGATLQTFDVSPPVASCSEEAPSCEAEPDPIGTLPVAPPKDAYAAAITVAIEDNWGKDEYTCLYRFRVHGDVASNSS